jgi:hypothetical protein
MAQSKERKEISDSIGKIQMEMVVLMKLIENSMYEDRYHSLHGYCQSFIALSNKEFVNTTDIADKE